MIRKPTKEELEYYAELLKLDTIQLKFVKKRIDSLLKLKKELRQEEYKKHKPKDSLFDEFFTIFKSKKSKSDKEIDKDDSLKSKDISDHDMLKAELNLIEDEKEAQKLENQNIYLSVGTTGNMVGKTLTAEQINARKESREQIVVKETKKLFQQFAKKYKNQ